MNDNGIDADTLSSTIQFLINGTTGNGLRPVDIPLEFTGQGDDLAIVTYPQNQNHGDSDEESSEEDVDNKTNILQRTIKQASGDYSNAFIEERWNELSEESSTNSTAKKIQLKKSFDMLRETANQMALRSYGQNSNGVRKAQEELKQDHEEPEQPKMDQRRNVKSKKKSLKFKNAAIESLLDIQNQSTTQPAEQETAEAGTSSSSKPVENGSKLPGQDIGRFRIDKYRVDHSLIRPECLNGYNANPDYDPRQYLANKVPALDDFPAL